MAKSKFQLLGMSLDEFEGHLKPNAEQKGEERFIIGRKARLIPSYRKLDELSLASVFLATLPLVKEFRELLFKEIGIARAGSIRVYTEISFPRFKIFEDGITSKGNLRVDGLLLQIVGKQIRDAAFFETKKGSQELYPQQINSYIDLARTVGVPRIVSISNQFVPSPTDYPIEILNNKGVNLFHFSWRYIIAIGSILLTDNDLNIEDPAQVLIMKEVMEFLMDPNVEAKTFDMMSKEWVQVVEGLLADEGFAQKNDSLITAAIQDWIQEEQDLALKLSDELGDMVDCNVKRCKTMAERIARERDSIVKDYKLNSEFKFANTVSPLNITLDVRSRRLFCEVEVKVPTIAKSDIGKKGPIGKQLRFVERQLNECKKKNETKFRELEQNLFITVKTKGRRANPCVVFTKFEELIEETLGSEVVSVQISYQVQFESRLKNRKTFISEYEAAVRNFYGVIVQYLKNYEEAPRKLEVDKPEEGETNKEGV